MRLFLCLFFLGLSHVSFCQFEISAGLAYEVPLGELGDVYKNSPAYQISILRGKKYKKTRSSVGVKFGYLSMKPKQDTLVFEIRSSSGVEFGKISYDDYQAYQVMMSWRCDKIISKNMEFFYGFDGGLHYAVFSYSEISSYNNDAGTEIISRIALSPRAGVNFTLTKSFAIGISGRYTASLGASEDPKNIFNQYLSSGVDLIFRL